MRIHVGEVEALFRYPVKSMRGEPVEEAELGWHGLDGDRRLALRRLDDRRGFPWLTATKLPELLLFTPMRRGADPAEGLPTHVHTPDGRELDLFGEELAAEIGGRHGTPVEMTHLDRGIFDEATVSAILTATVEGVAMLVDQPLDIRRFRPNIVIASPRAEPFAEDAWVGGVLTFGEGDAAAAIAVTNRDTRCSMVNYDPDSAARSREVLQAVIRERNNCAGIYGTVIRRGRLAVGQPIHFAPAAEQPERAN